MTTTKQVYEYLLIELNKREAPSLLLGDYNYYLNREIKQYANKIYNLYETNNQSCDDLDALKKVNHPLTLTFQTNYYKGTIPTDYFHLLNCSVKFNVISALPCQPVGSTFEKRASKLTSNQSRGVEENFYFKPSYKNPYFVRNNTLLEIRSGSTAEAVPTIAYIDYLRVPSIVNLTQEQLDNPIDTSQSLEFPDYVVQEIINDLVNLLMENTSDPRLQTHIPTSQSIARPGQHTK